MSKITNDIKNVNLSTEFMPGMTIQTVNVYFLGSVICRNEIVCKKLKYKKVSIYMIEIRVNPLALIQKFLSTYLYM